MTSAVKPPVGFLVILAIMVSGFAWSLSGSDPAIAQTVSKDKPVDGRKTVISGIKSYEAGRMDTAVTTLTKAISGGGLSSQDLAKALYFRGLAHQRSKKSAQAIADLTSAVWMKGGLSPSEQQAALAARSKAYAEVGVSDPGPPVASIGKPAPAAPPSSSAPAPAKTQQLAAIPKVVATPKPVATPRVTATPKVAATTSSGFQTQVKRSVENSGAASAEPAASTDNSLSGVGNFFSNLFSGGSTAPASQLPAATTPPASGRAATAPVVYKPVVTPPLIIAPATSAPRVAIVETPTAVSPPVRPAPVEPKKVVVSAPVQDPFETTMSRAPSPPPAGSSPRVASTRQSVASATPPIAATVPSAAPPRRHVPMSNKGVSLSSLAELSSDTVGSFYSNIFGGGESSSSASKAAPAVGSNTAVSAWTSDPSAAAGNGAAGQSRGVPATTASIGRRAADHKLQVAAVRSREEAERVVLKLRQRHAAKIGARRPVIREKVYGNMGTFYQVNVGPFAKSAETAQICAAFKADGFDCLIVKN